MAAAAVLLATTGITVAAAPATYPLPDHIDTSFKAWMDYRSITDETSKQWELQQQASTDEDGLRRLDDHYMVALGTYYADQCGDVFEIQLEDGQAFTAVVGDVKADLHTDDLHMYHPISDKKGNLVEFIVDVEELHEDVIDSGDLSSVGFEGQVIQITKLEEDAY